MNACDARPWYREPWPWLLMAGPAIVVVGAVTMWLAIEGNDGLVADDYYKRGLAINQVLARDQAAQAHGYTANVAFDFNHGRVRVALAGDELPPALVFGEPLAASRTAVYTVGFFVFWVFAAASSALTCFLQRSAAEINRMCPLEPEARPPGCPKRLEADCGAQGDGIAR